MIDFTTTYLGKTLANPIVCSSSPLTQDFDTIRRLEDAGIGAIVMHSLFEEQINLESLDLHYHLEAGAESNAEATNYFPDMRDYNTGPDGYLEMIRRSKAAVGVPIIGSLNGTTRGGWIRYAKEMQEAGADAIELNVYDIPTNPNVTSEQVERYMIDLVRDVKSRLSVPLAVKIGSFFTAPANLVKRLHEAGAAGVVLFNRFYQPDLDIDNLDVSHHHRFSNSEELLPRLHWAAILFGRVPIDIAITGGVHTARDILKCMMAGANVAMATSALMKHGVSHVRQLLTDLRHWMHEHEYSSIGQMRGSLSLRRVPDPTAYERGNYMQVLRRQATATQAYEWSRWALMNIEPRHQVD